MNAPHVAIRASAGSGKTFQLTNRLLQLFFVGTPIDQIVAATFTRKAAGEILERLFLRLAKASESKNAATELGNQIGVSGATPARVVELLSGLLRRLHELRIGTLDGLFADLASSLSPELGLPAQWSILDSILDGELRDDAIRRMLSAGPSSDLLALFRALTQGETTRSVARQIRDAVDDLYAIFRATTDEQWTPFELPARMEADEWQGAVEALSAYAPPANKNFQKGLANVLKAAKALDWKAFIAETLVQYAAAGAAAYYKVKIAPELRHVCTKLLAHAKGEVLAELHQSAKALRKLMEHFHREYDRLKKSRRGLVFEDVTFALAQAGDSNEDGPDVGYRLGTTTKHLLLDEFQDTSPMQWKVVERAAESIAAEAEGHSFFCVGDEKQAIYAWRGGDPELFDRIASGMPSLEWKSLATSYRSASAIIDAVNAAFADLETNPVFHEKDRDALLKGARLWAKGFTKHNAEKAELRGYVCVKTAPLVDGEDGKKVSDRYGAAAKWIEAELAKRPGISVGVLTRKNDGVARMIDELRRRGIQASQEGGNPLTDSTAVQAVLTALRFADHPGDSAGRFFVAATPLGKRLGLTMAAKDPNANRVAAKIRRQLLDDGLGATVAEWSEALLPELGTHERERLQRLVEFAFVQEDAAGLRPSRFAEIVEQTLFEDPGASQVRVMTIHQSKGLEFDVVVLPELDERLIGQTPRVLAWAGVPGGMIDRVVPYVDESVQRLLPSEIRDAFLRREVRAVRESLCLLYVAMTRAIQSLLVVVNPPTPNERTLPQTMAGVLRGALVGAKAIDADAVWFEHGDREWGVRKERSEVKYE